MNAAAKEACRYCGQVLYIAPDGHFECGGDGEGICSFWSAIGDYQRDGCPPLLETWLDGWIQDEVGVGWIEMGWDREAHAAAIHNYLSENAR